MTNPNHPITPVNLGALKVGDTIQLGLNKREHFALEILKCLLNKNSNPTPEVVFLAVQGANHLINALNKGQ